MAQKRKKKSQRKSRTKSGVGKLFFFSILIGLGLLMVYLFRQEISNALKPWVEKKSILKETKVITLYFSEPEGEYLVGEKREISRKDKVEEEAKEAVNELIKGPKSTLIPTLPFKTKLLTLQIDEGGVAKVNFDQTLSKEHPGGSSAEMMTVYSIVNSLTINFPTIQRVRFLVEGEKIETIAGHLSLKQPVSSKLDLVKK